MAAFCARHGYSGRTKPELLVERLHTNLLSASAETTARKAVTAILFVDQLELLNTQVRTIKGIRELLVQHPGAVIFLSFTGMGKRCGGVGGSTPVQLACTVGTSSESCRESWSSAGPRPVLIRAARSMPLAGSYRPARSVLLIAPSAVRRVRHVTLRQLPLGDGRIAGPRVRSGRSMLAGVFGQMV